MASTNNQPSCIDCAAITSRAAHFEDDEPSLTVGAAHDGSAEPHYHAHTLSHEDHEEDSPCEGNCRPDGLHDGTGDLFANRIAATPAINLHPKHTSKKPEQESVAINKKSTQIPSAENGSSKPEQKAVAEPAANKSALKATTNKSAADTQSKSKRNPRRSAFSNEDDDTSEGSSSDEQPKAKRSGRKMKSKKNPPISSESGSDADDHSQAHGNSSSPPDGCSHCNGGNDEHILTSSSRQETDAELVSITLFHRRRLQICGFSNAFASYIGNEIAKYDGLAQIRKERVWGLGYEFKLKGDPWGMRKGHATGTIIEGLLKIPAGVINGDAGSAREEVFLRHMLRVMLSNGFEVHQMTQSLKFPGTIYFEKAHSRTRTMETMTIAFHNPNRLRVTCAPPEFIYALESLLKKDPEFKGERTKTEKLREKKRAKKIATSWSSSETSKEADQDAVEYVIPRVSWQSAHVWFQYARMPRRHITGSHQFRLSLMKILREQGWKPTTSIDRKFRSNSSGTEHVALAWYYQREKPLPRGKQLG